MTFDKMFFKELWNTRKKKVKIGNGECIALKGKGAIAITSGFRTMFIANVLYVPVLDQNLLIIGQLMENKLNMFFKKNMCHRISIRRYDIQGQNGGEVFPAQSFGRRAYNFSYVRQFY